MKDPDPPGRGAPGRCTKDADCQCGRHPAPPPRDETCRLARTLELGGLRLEVWTCSKPEPRPAQGEFTLGVFKRGEPILAPAIWPGSSEAWSCNTPVWPGHIDLVLYQGGPESAERTQQCVLAHEAQEEAKRTEKAKAEASAAYLRSIGAGTYVERMALWAAARRTPVETPAAKPGVGPRPRRLPPGKVTSPSSGPPAKSSRKVPAERSRPAVWGDFERRFGKGPPADETCRIVGTIDLGGRIHQVWGCSETYSYRPKCKTRSSVYLFPSVHTRRHWPGAKASWYDAVYHEFGCYPGRSTFVVYQGGVTLRERRRKARGRAKARGLRPSTS